MQDVQFHKSWIIIIDVNVSCLSVAADFIFACVL